MAFTIYLSDSVRHFKNIINKHDTGHISKSHNNTNNQYNEVNYVNNSTNNNNDNDNNNNNNNNNHNHKIDSVGRNSNILVMNCYDDDNDNDYSNCNENNDNNENNNNNEINRKIISTTTECNGEDITTKNDIKNPSINNPQNPGVSDQNKTQNVDQNMNENESKGWIRCVREDIEEMWMNNIINKNTNINTNINTSTSNIINNLNTTSSTTSVASFKVKVFLRTRADGPTKVRELDTIFYFSHIIFKLKFAIDFFLIVRC